MPPLWQKSKRVHETLSDCFKPNIPTLNTISLEYTLLHKNIRVEKICMKLQHVIYCHSCLFLPMNGCHIKCWASNVLFHIRSPFSRPKDHVLFLAVIYFSIFHWFYLMWSFDCPSIYALSYYYNGIILCVFDWDKFFIYITWSHS